MYSTYSDSVHSLKSVSRECGGLGGVAVRVLAFNL